MINNKIFSSDIMGIFDLFRKKQKKQTKQTKTEFSFPPSEKEITNFISEEMEKRNNMTPKELKEYNKNLDELKKQTEKEFKEMEENREKLDNWVTNNIQGETLENQGKIDEAIKCYENNVKTKADTPFTYTQLANLYHFKKEFKKEKSTLKKGISKCRKNPNPNHIKTMKEQLENVENFLNTGKWKYDCLPSDPKKNYDYVREAKTLLKSDNKAKGVEMLETLMKNGTYNNTVYNTLFQTYKKEKQFDEAIRVCNKAIEELGFFSNDRKERWSINLDKVTKQKEKAK